jgi:hypothetical protein
MASELKPSRAGSTVSISVGERVTVGESGTEFVVVSVDHATGRLELLRMNPGRIESNIPSANVQRKSQTGPHPVSNESH